MISNVIARLCMGFVFVIVVAVLSKAHWSAEQIGFFVIGMVTAGALGFIWTWLEGWARRGGRPGQPQTITLHTDETPGQITWAAIQSFFLLLLLCVGLLLLAALAVTVAFNVDLIGIFQSLLKL